MTAKPLIYVIALIVLGLADRLLKFFVLTLTQPIHFSNWFITLHRNTGAVFSLYLSLVAIYILSGLVIGLLFWWLYKNIKLQAWARVLILVLILLGGVSNLWDRIFLNGVIDVIMAPNGLTFNLADIYLLTGVVLYFKNR